MHLQQPSHHQHPSIETPVKKQRNLTHSDLKTAESPVHEKMTIADVQAEQLFKEFNKIVTITEQEEEICGPSAYRKLDFEDQDLGKLNFDQSTASMKKRKKSPKKSLNFEIIKPLRILDEQFAKQNDISVRQTVCTPPKKTKSQTGILQTPTKKIQLSEELSKAARKEDPFRDLAPINQ